MERVLCAQEARSFMANMAWKRAAQGNTADTSRPEQGAAMMILAILCVQVGLQNLAFEKQSSRHMREG